MVPVATRTPNISNIFYENCTQTVRVYWSKNPIELLYIYTGKWFKIQSSDMF